MNQLTAFTPGTRVRTFPTGETGTVAESAPRYASLPGFVPVIFDGHTTARPCAADNLAVIAAPAILEPAITAGSDPQDPAWDSLHAMELHVIHEIEAAGATPERFDVGFIVDAAFMWDDNAAAFIQKPGKTIAWASHWARLY